MNVIGLARSLGWLSIGLGAVKILAGRRLAVGLGMPGRAKLIRGYGMRGVATGAAILANPASAPLLWARVGGDAMDIVTLAVTPSFGKRERATARLALGAVIGLTVLDLLCATRLSTADDEELASLPPYWED